jgi:hypothetical protein
MSENNPAAPWWSRPLGMGLLGLALMVAGWQFSTWIPLTAHEREQAARLDELRKRADAENQKELVARLDESARSVQRTPPYQSAGRLAIFVGLALFVVAGVRMYRAPTPPEEPLSAEEPEREEEPEAAPEG